MYFYCNHDMTLSPPLLYIINTPDLLLAEVLHAPGHLPGEAQDVLPGDLVLSHQPLVLVHITWSQENTVTRAQFSSKDTYFQMTRLSVPYSCA